MTHSKKPLVGFLLGEHLGHSFSPQIHSLLSDYCYSLRELSKEELGPFVKNKGFDFLNVTIPYKKDVIPYLDGLSDEARELGSVNTVKKLDDGRLWGYSTDTDGFELLLKKSCISVSFKKVLVLGSGGASLPIKSVLRKHKASEIVTISRSGENNYDNISKHSDADVIINTTPVGMYPNNGVSPVDLDGFNHLSGVIDIIYNPSKTKLLLDADRLNIPNMGGLYMLVGQAKRACEIFLDANIDDSEIDRICAAIESDTKNIVLVGMPGCGKSTVGKLVASILGRDFFDSDKVFEEKFGASPAEIIKSFGEAKFREMEHEVILELGKLSSSVIATGGGVVTVEKNYEPLHQNGTIFFIERKLENLATKNRPLSQAYSVEALYETRYPMYVRFSDHKIVSNEVKSDTANKIVEIMKAGKI